MNPSSPTTAPLDLSRLSAWAPELARTFVTLASDIALVIDADGVIRTLEQGAGEPVASAAGGWVGRSWVDTVSGETRGKIEKLLAEASTAGGSRRREVNHPLQSGINVPVAYTAIRLGENGPVLAVGRDMRAIAAIQQRFIESQQDLERGYWKARQSEARDLLLSQVVSDAVLVVDAETLLIVDASPAATAMFSAIAEPLVGKHAAIGLAHPSRAAFNDLLDSARSSGQSSELRVRLLGTVTATTVVATSFRAGDGMRLLVRLRSAHASASAADASAPPTDAARPSAVVTDSSGRILLADVAFLGLVGVVGNDVHGHLLAEWLGEPDRSMATLLHDVRRHGLVRSFSTRLRPVGAAPQQVEVSAALLTEGDQERIGFTLRCLATPQALPAVAATPLEALARVAGEIGTRPLTSLVGDVAAWAEAQLLALALERSGGDVAAAATLLQVDPRRFDALAGAPAILDAGPR